MKKNDTFKVLIFTVMMLVFVARIVNAAAFWDQAKEWYDQGSTNTYLDVNVINDLGSMVEVVGTGVIAIATVVLGIKYVLGSVTDKASVKENMITLLVACIFFFGWSNIRSVVIKGVNFTGAAVAEGGISQGAQIFLLADGATLEQALAQVFSIVIAFAKVIAVICTLYMGVKYIFSGAEGKAKLKEKGIMYIVGIILIFTTLNILSFISDAIVNSIG